MSQSTVCLSQLTEVAFAFAIEYVRETDYGPQGSAPDISGKGIVNPIGTILSVAMMFKYSLNLPNEAKTIEQAVKNAIDSGVLTKDLGGSATTKEMGDAVVKELEKALKK